MLLDFRNGFVRALATHGPLRVSAAASRPLLGNNHILVSLAHKLVIGLVSVHDDNSLSSLDLTGRVRS